MTVPVATYYWRARCHRGLLAKLHDSSVVPATLVKPTAWHKSLASAGLAMKILQAQT